MGFGESKYTQSQCLSLQILAINTLEILKDIIASLPMRLPKHFLRVTKSNCHQQEESFYTRNGIRLPIPDNLKSLLVDDWENVTKNLTLVPLPHDCPITQILRDYLEQQTSKLAETDPENDILDEIVHGMREYFDKSIGRILLYRFERKQYLDLAMRMEGKQPEAHKPNAINIPNQSVESADAEGKEQPTDKDVMDITGKGPADVYGAEHLARLIVSMPELIGQTSMDVQAINRLRDELQKLTQFLSKNAGKYFAPEYEAPTSEYVNAAKMGF